MCIFVADFVVWQKPTQLWKAAILQLLKKKINKNKNKSLSLHEVSVK